jgi:phage terminase large subunit GpA-like protein
MVGVDTAKDVVYGRLKITQKGPGYIHFPAHDAINQQYFDQLTAEHVITKYRFGRPYRKWELPSGKRNEALDTFAYALAARMSRPVRLSDGGPHGQVPPAVQEIREVEQAGTGEDVHSMVDEIRPPQPQYARPAIRHSEFEKGGWMGGRRERGWFDRD